MKMFLPKWLQPIDFDENVDLSMTCLGRIDMKREEKMKAEEVFQFQSKVLLWENVRWSGMSDIIGHRCK